VAAVVTVTVPVSSALGVRGQADPERRGRRRPRAPEAARQRSCALLGCLRLIQFVNVASGLFFSELGARLTAGISALAVQVGGEGAYLLQQLGQLEIGVLACEPGRHLALRISFQMY
jgi:hypothetical protein